MMTKSFLSLVYQDADFGYLTDKNSTARSQIHPKKKRLAIETDFFFNRNRKMKVLHLYFCYILFLFLRIHGHFLREQDDVKQWFRIVYAIGIVNKTENCFERD